MAVTVNLSIDTESIYHPSESDFHYWINAIMPFLSNTEKQHNRNEVNVAIIDKKRSQHLNLQFRQQDKATNVLSFPNCPVPGEASHSLGDLAICSAVVNQEAHDQHKSEKSHWAHITVHGMLHLLDFDHQTDVEAKQMEQLEIEILSLLGYDNPYEENE